MHGEDSDVNDAAKQPNVTQAVEPVARKKGKSRVQARHLSPILRRVVVDTFRAKLSSEDVAEDLRIPVRAVTDVLLAEAFGLGLRRVS